VYSVTCINLERRRGVPRKLNLAPGKALADFHIFKLVADYWGCGEMFREWDSPEAVFQLLKQLSVDQPCDITGIDTYEMIEVRGGIQWPYTSRQTPTNSERRLF